MTSVRPPSGASSRSAASVSSSHDMAKWELRWISFWPVPLPASCSARLTSPRLRSSSVSGASRRAWASWRSKPRPVSSSAVVAKMVSRKCSEPSSRTSVRRVAAKSIFCRTGAASGTYVTATSRGAASCRRRMMYSASLGLRCGPSRPSTLSLKEPPGPDGVRKLTGVRDSPLMVASSPKCVSVERSVLNWETSSCEAVLSHHRNVLAAGRSSL